MRTSDDYIDSNVRLGLSAAGMVSLHTIYLLIELCLPSPIMLYAQLQHLLQINAINGKKIHLLVPDRPEYVRSYKM